MELWTFLIVLHAPFFCVHIFRVISEFCIRFSFQHFCLFHHIAVSIQMNMTILGKHFMKLTFFSFLELHLQSRKSAIFPFDFSFDFIYSNLLTQKYSDYSHWKAYFNCNFELLFSLKRSIFALHKFDILSGQKYSNNTTKSFKQKTKIAGNIWEAILKRKKKWKFKEKVRNEKLHKCSSK